MFPLRFIAEDRIFVGIRVDFLLIIFLFGNEIGGCPLVLYMLLTPKLTTSFPFVFIVEIFSKSNSCLLIRQVEAMSPAITVFDVFESWPSVRIRFGTNDETWFLDGNTTRHILSVGKETCRLTGRDGVDAVLGVIILRTGRLRRSKAGDGFEARASFHDEEWSLHRFYPIRNPLRNSVDKKVSRSLVPQRTREPRVPPISLTMIRAHVLRNHRSYRSVSASFRT